MRQKSKFSHWETRDWLKTFCVSVVKRYVSIVFMPNLVHCSRVAQQDTNRQATIFPLHSHWLCICQPFTSKHPRCVIRVSQHTAEHTTSTFRTMRQKKYFSVAESQFYKVHSYQVSVISNSEWAGPICSCLRTQLGRRGNHYHQGGLHVSSHQL